MQTFVEQVEHSITILEQAKLFAQSPETQRARNVNEFYWGCDTLPIALGCVVGLFALGMIASVIAMVGGLSAALWFVGPVLLGACVVALRGTVYASHVLRKWSAKASAVRLGGFYSAGEFYDMEMPMPVIGKENVIEACHKAGATSTQIQQLWALTKDVNIPKAWWETLGADARHVNNMLYHHLQEINEYHRAHKRNDTYKTQDYTKVEKTDCSRIREYDTQSC